MADSDIAFHMGLQNVLLLQLISIGVCVLSTTLSDTHRGVSAWIVPTLISLFSIYICMTMLQSSQCTTTEPGGAPCPRRNTKWNGVVYIILAALVLNVLYAGYNMLKQRTLESLWLR